VILILFDVIAVITVFDAICPPAKVTLVAFGVDPFPYTVRVPAAPPVGLIAVTSNATADTLLDGTPDWPPTFTSRVLPAPIVVQVDTDVGHRPVREAARVSSTFPDPGVYWPVAPALAGSFTDVSRFAWSYPYRVQPVGALGGVCEQFPPGSCFQSRFPRPS
jgi:hypothetical protein